jgi:outer membrane protein OmpA-like peptidoglycan-associated protein
MSCSWTVVRIGVLVVLLAGCSGSPSRSPRSDGGVSAMAPSKAAAGPGGGPASSPPSSGAGGLNGPAVDQAVATRSVDAAGDRLDMEMLPLVRDRGETAVVSVRTTLVGAAGAADSASVTRHFSTVTAGPFDDVRLVDEAGQRVFLAAPANDGGRCVCTEATRLAVGETVLLQTAFTGVPAAVTHLSVMLPYAGVFADVPIMTGTAPSPGGPDATGPAATDMRATSAGATRPGATGPPVTGGGVTWAGGGVALDLADAGASPMAELDAYTERLDVPLRAKRTPARVDLSLDSDVLFRVDSARLTPAAAKAVGAAAEEVRRSGPGPVSVTGHTDSDADAVHNQRLSEARARTVAAALAGRLPARQWPQTVTGKGETEPAVPNDTAEHRRLNRRVTISYRPSAAPAAKPPPPAAVALPKTKGRQDAAGRGVEVAFPLGRGTVRFTAGRAVVRGTMLQVDLQARNVGGGDATILNYLGQGVFTVRDELDPYAPFGASGVRAFAGDTVAYNLDYLSERGGHRCLCDRLLNQPFPPGSTRTIALWFPAPPPGTATITLDVPDRFRLTAVPVG